MYPFMAKIYAESLSGHGSALHVPPHPCYQMLNSRGETGKWGHSVPGWGESYNHTGGCMKSEEGGGWGEW